MGKRSAAPNQPGHEVLPACDIERDRHLMGTAEYVAPEAIQGRIQAASAHLSDLYALGVLAFELLVGKQPFSRKGSPQDTLLAHLEEPVPDVQRDRPDVPLALAILVQDLLAKSPEERPDAGEVLWRTRALDADPPRRTLEILVVHDRGPLARELAQAARQALPSALVRIAASGDEALACIDERCPDLLVADLDLRGVNGLELCMYLQGSGRRVPVVMVCGKPQPRDARLLSQLGVKQLIPTTNGWIERFRAALTDASRRASH